MAESKFLKWQDQDGDGLIDDCDDLIETPELPVCLNCSPNPKALVPDWREFRVTQPFLNEKLCEYQITKVTPHTTTVDSALLENEEENSVEIKASLEGRYDEFVDEAIDSLLEFTEKDDSDESKAKVKNDIKYYKYELPPRPNSRLKLLYSVPFDTIFDLPERAPEPEEEEEEEPGEMIVKYAAADIMTKMIKIRKALNLYGRYLKVYRAMDGGNIFFSEDNRIFNLESYGDPALFTHSILSDLLTTLESYFNTKNYQMPGVGGITFFKDKIVSVEFKTNNYKLKRIKIWTEGCGERPIWFNKKKLKPLLAQSAWKDETAVAYLMQLFPMESAIMARVPDPWQEFIIKFTYPPVYSTLDQSSPEDLETAGSCVADALANEAKELGQDILDDVFGLGDAIAYLFHKNICRYDITETRADNIEMGLLPAAEFGAGTTLEKYSGVGPLTGPDAVLGKGNKANMFGMAQMQAFKQLDAQDQVFAQLCGRILASMIGFGPAQSKMDQMWEYGFERIKQCGLFDLMMEAIACLLGGLSIDEMMAAMLKAALDSMGIENFGELFIGIPPEKQSELAAKVSEKLASGDLGVSRQREEATLQAAGIGVDTPPRPWENQDIIDSERKNRGNSEAGKYGQTAQEQSQETRRTLAKQFDVAGSAEEELDTDIVMEAYILALMEVYSDNLMALLDLLNKFPGAPIIASVLAMMDCPRPPLFNPSVLDFLKDIQLPWCRNKNEIRFPRLENPFAYLPKLKDLTWLLWQLIKEALMQLVMTIIIKLMVKICQIIGDAICKAMETLGDVAASMPEILQGSTTLKDVIKESICGPNATEQQVEDTIVEIMGTMGPGAAAFSNRDQVLQFAEDVSSSVTRRELTDAILGTPSREFTEIVSQLIEFEYPEYEKAMPTPDSIGNLFKNMGNLMPLDFRKQLQDLSESDPENELMPANPTLCATTEQLENFKNLRCELLGGRASKEQCDVMYDNLRSGFLEDLETLSGALQGTPGQPGIEGYIMDNMPPLVSAPGCDDGLIPFMSDAEAAVAAQAMGNDFEQLKIDYAKDMLGNGGLFQGDAGWGLINLVLSDTEGNPLTAHWRKAFNRKSYVHFATNLPNGGESATGFFSALQPQAGFSSQHGQFPYYVGEWLMRQFLNAGEGYIDDFDSYTPRGGTMGSDFDGIELQKSIGFVSKNDSIGSKKYRISFEELDFSTYMGGGVDLLRVPDFGYNVRLGVDYVNQNIIITRRARKGGESSGDSATYTKGGSDISLDYKDNAAGKRYTCGRGMSAEKNDTAKREQSEWSYGFEVQLFLSDIIEDGTEMVPVPDEFLPDELKGAGFQIFNAEDAGEYADAWEAAKAAAQAAGHDNAGTTISVYKNRPDDNARIKIIEKVNMDATVESPFAELVQEELEKSDAFDLPAYIEKIPIVGWTLQLLVNIIMFPFSNLVRPESAPGIGSTSESIMRVREFEFLTIDDGLDDVDFAEFPALLDAFETKGEYIPQVVALAEMIGSTDLASVKTQHDDFMTQFFQKIAGEIGTNTLAWKHGASYDYLTKSDKDYLDSEGGPYEDQSFDGVPVSNDDMILGISRDQFDNEAKGTPENTRIFYLDPAKFGGNYMRPPIYIKPLAYEGWMGLVQVLFPEYTACKPHNVELVDFDEIQDKINERYPRIPEDPRLKSDPDCAVETPYNRIMSRSARASMGGLIEAAIRIYASTHFFKSIGTFSKIMPKFPDNYSSLYSQYIVEVMEEGFKDAQADHWEAFSPFKDEEFWYAFLEQSVQYYGWLVDDGVIQDPPASVISAIKELNNMQEEYDFPWWDDWWEAVKLGDSTLFQGLKGYRSDKNLEAVQKSEELAKLVLKELVNIQLTYMGTQLVSNLRARGFNPTIFDLDYWIFEEQCNGTQEGDSPLRFAGPEIVEEVVDLPSAEVPDPTGQGYSYPGPYYTAGAQFRIAESNDPSSTGLGEEYMGYYHIHIDEAADPVYVSGEYHSDEGQDLLQPVAKLTKIGTLGYAKASGGWDEQDPPQVIDVDVDSDAYDRTAVAATFNIVYLGDIPVLGSAANEGKPYYIEKYINVNGAQLTPAEAETLIKSRGKVLISEAFPGTMKQVFAPPAVNAAGEIVPGEPEAIGIEGELGVRFGLQFSYNSGSKIPITTVEVDALDFPCDVFNANITNSKLLFCLINKLKEDPLYKMMVSYIFPLKKVTATLAIYNDMAFLSSIGEVTVDKGDATAWIPTGKAKLPGTGPDFYTRSDWLNPEGSELWKQKMRSKPGSVAYIDREIKAGRGKDPNWHREPDHPDGANEELYDIDIWSMNQEKSGTSGWEGWQHYDDRQPGPFGGMFVKEWDNWDRVLLRKSKSRIKKMFRAYYNSREFTPGESTSESPSKIMIKNLKERLLPSPAAGLLPWWQRGKIRPNPHNADGTLCDKPD